MERTDFFFKREKTNSFKILNVIIIQVEFVFLKADINEIEIRFADHIPPLTFYNTHTHTLTHTHSVSHSFYFPFSIDRLRGRCKFLKGAFNQSKLFHIGLSQFDFAIGGKKKIFIS